MGASAVFIACWALAGFYQALGPSVGAHELGHSGSLFGGLTVAALVFPSAFGGPFTARLKPRTAMVSGSTVLGLALVAILVSLNAHSTVGFLIASVIAGLAFGSAFGGAMRLLVGGLAPTDRAGLLSAIYLFSYLGAALPAFISGLLVAPWGLPAVVDGFGALVIVLVIVAIVIVLVAGRSRQRGLAHVSP